MGACSGKFRLRLEVNKVFTERDGADPDTNVVRGSVAGVHTIEQRRLGSASCEDSLYDGLGSVRSVCSKNEWSILTKHIHSEAGTGDADRAQANGGKIFRQPSSYRQKRCPLQETDGEPHPQLRGPPG